jgi:hypothetical protein
MNADGTARSGENPAEVYSRELQQLLRVQAMDERQERRLGYAKVAIVLGAIAVGLVFLRHRVVLEWLGAPLAVFVWLALLHERVIGAIALRARSIRFYEGGLARIEDRWAGSGESGERFLDALHPYARDLDLFGKGSLFDLLATVRTRAGEETLAAWLLAPAKVEEIVARQAAVRDLDQRWKFRERLFVLGETVRLGVDPERLAEWAERKPVFGEGRRRVATTVLALLWIASLIYWGVSGHGMVAGLMTLLNFAWAHRIHAGLEEASGALERAADGLGLLAGVMLLMEQEPVTAPRLLELRAQMKHEGRDASAAIGGLARIAGYLEGRHNMLARVPDLVTFWSAQFVFAAERWQQECGPQVRDWLRVVGEYEALSALSNYAFEHPDDVFPEFSDGSALFEAEGLAHPLLPAVTAVRNDVKLGDGPQLMILSGPNMAGKSTFIRSIGVNAVLAQCGAPVRAMRLRLSPLRVAASICILDSLSGGVSRFYAEIQRVKMVFDLAQQPVPVLFLFDELLSGTNSHDRLEGTRFVVESLVERGAIGVVSTHDLALAAIPKTMGERAANWHFEDRYAEGRLVFDYTLKRGVVQTSNALELMRSIGLGVKIAPAGVAAGERNAAIRR